MNTSVKFVRTKGHQDETDYDLDHPAELNVLCDEQAHLFLEMIQAPLSPPSIPLSPS